MQFITSHIFFLILWGFAFTGAPEPPRMVGRPPYVQVFYVAKEECGESKVPFTLPCEATGTPPLSYKWVNNGRELTMPAHDGRYALGSDNSSLVFFEPLDIDAGLYECIAKNSYGTAISRVITVRKGTVDFIEKKGLIHKEVEEGSTLMLPCDAPSGSPIPLFYWVEEQSGGVLNFINHPELVVDLGDNLWFTYIDPTMDGMVFRCLSYFPIKDEYKFGTKYSLSVKKVPLPAQRDIKLLYVTKSPVNIIEGEDIELFCIAGGAPQIQMSIFTKDRNNLIKQAQNMESRHQDKSLLIRNVTTEDSGKYFCEVSGKGILATIDLVVNEDPVPKVWFPSDKVEAVLGEKIELVCETKGNPKPVIYWTHNGKLLIDSDFSQRFKPYENRLIFENVTNEDTGNYGCKAVNIHGEDYADLSMIVSRSEPPKISTSQSIGPKKVGTRAVLICRASGYPTPQIKWTKNEQPIINDYRYSITPLGDLQIKDLKTEDAGNYVCQASNSAGQAMQSVVLHVL